MKAGLLKTSKFVIFSFIVLLSVFFIAGISLPYTAPFLLKTFSPRLLNGHQLTVDKVSIDYQKNYLELGQISLNKPDSSSDTSPKIKNIALHMDFNALREKHIHIKSLSIGGFRGNLKEIKSDWKLGDILLSQLTATTDSHSNANNSASTKTDGASSSPWTFQIDQLKLNNWTSQLLTSTVESDVYLKSINVHHFDSRDKSLDLRLDVNMSLSDSRIAFKQTGPSNNSSKIEALLLPGQHHINIKSATIRGNKTSPSLSTSLEISNINAKLEMKPQLAKQHEGETIQLINIAKLQLVDFSAENLNDTDAMNISMASFGLDKIRIFAESDLSDEKTQATTIESTKLSGIALSDQHLTFDDIAIRQISGRVDFLENHKLKQIQPLLQAISNNNTDNTATSAATPEKGPEELDKNMVKVTVEQLSIEDVDMSIVDHNIEPSNTIEATIASIKAEDFNYPYSNISQATPTSFNVNLGIQKLGKFTLQGSLFLNENKITAQAEYKLKNLNLVDFSPYIQKRTGYFVHTGQLNSEGDVKLSDDIVNASNKIRLNAIELERAPSDKPNEIDQLITMPLDSALGLLRDDDGDIEIELPINGNINSPEFGSGDVLRQVSTTALRTASLSYLKYAFQPYGTLITVGSWLNDQAQKIRLDPLMYPNGQSALNSEQQSYLQKLAELMSKKQALRIKACPIIVNAELEWQIVQLTAQDNTEKKTEGQNTKSPDNTGTDVKTQAKKKLEEVSQLRLDALRNELSVKHQIAAERIISCKTQFSNDDKEVESYIHLQI